MLVRASVAAPVVLLAWACTSFPGVTAGTCGNGVVDPATEDCDTYPATGATNCRPAGAFGECRYDCTSGSEHSCPPAFGCGHDGICRTGSSTFKFETSFPGPGVQTVSLADFNGDGRADVLDEASTETRVSFFDTPAQGSFALTSQFQIPIPLARAIPASLSNDPSDSSLADVILTSSFGVDTWRGQPDSTLSPVVYPSFAIPGQSVRLVALQALPSVAGEQLLALGSGPTGSGIGRVLGKGATLTAMFPTTNGPDALAGDVVVAKFVESTMQPLCDDFALAFKNESSVHVFTPCRANALGSLVLNTPGATQKLLPDVHVPANVSGVLASYLNQDVHVDLLIGTGSGSSFALYAAYGVGDGTFNSSATVPPLNGDGNASPFTLALTGGTTATAFPLAAGDLNGDGLSDFVLPSAIVLSVTGQSTYAPAVTVLQTWSLAGIADYNSNGIADVVTTNGTIVDFYNGATKGLFNHAQYTTTGAITFMAKGDVDGDLVTDIVLGTNATDASGATIMNEGALVVLFGQPGGYPEQPDELGALPTLDQVFAAPLEAPLVNSGQSAAGIADIVAVSTDMSNPTEPLLIAALPGRADRALTSPFYLFDAQDSTVRGYGVERFVTGNFTQAGHADIGALAFDSAASGSAARLWLAPMTGDAAVTTGAIRATGDLIGQQSLNGTFGRLSPIDLDAPSAGGLEEVVVALPPASAGAQGELLVATQQGGVFVPSSPTSLGIYDSHLWILRRGDINADGAIDALLLFSDAGSSGVVRRLRVMWNRLSGNLDPNDGVDVPSIAPDTPLNFFPLNVDGDPQLEIIVVGEQQSYLAKLDATGKNFLPNLTVLPFGAGTVLGGGDMNGDGLEDVVVGSLNTLRAYQNVPRLPGP